MLYSVLIFEDPIEEILNRLYLEIRIKLQIEASRNMPYKNFYTGEYKKVKLKSMQKYK